MKSILLIFFFLVNSTLIAQFKGECQYVFEGIEYDIFDIVINNEVLKEISLEGNSGSETHRQFVDRIGGSKAFLISTTSFDDNCSPIGWLNKNGKEENPVNSSPSGNGNFFIQPNGALLFTDNEALIVETAMIPSVQRVQNGFQSGPMLVIDGTVNSTINQNSTNLNYRSGAGVYSDKNNVKHLVFAISRSPVTFYKLARLFSESLLCKSAIALSSANCAMHLPYQSGSTPIQGAISNCLYLKIKLP